MTIDNIHQAVSFKFEKMSKTAIFATKKSLFVDNLVGMILGQYPFLGTITLNDKKEYEINNREFYSSIGLLSKD